MKKFITISLFIFAISCVSNNSSHKTAKTQITNLEPSQDFVQGSEDIPLLEGMEKVFDEGLGFDSANGSIMSSTYSTKDDIEAIKSFYLKTLPQMGWTLTKAKNSAKSENNKTKFKRENEQLEIEFITNENKNIVKFFISSVL